MRKIIYYFEIILLFLSIYFLIIKCQTRNQEKLFDEEALPSKSQLSKKYYRYDFYNQISFGSKLKGEKSFYPIIYTNVEKTSKKVNIPRGILRRDYPEFEDVNYFIKKLNGEYVFYLEKNKEIVMREYGKWYDFDKDRHTQDSIKVLSSRLDTDEKIFNYLKKNNIKYKLISKKTDGYYKSEIKILLEANQCYTYITYTPNFIVTNMYYNAKDTLSLRNNFGKAIFRY